MPRRARLRFAGIPLHIIQRGNNRIACFFAKQDCRLYLYHLEELAQRYVQYVNSNWTKKI